MATITAMGVGSNLDINGIITSLMKAESQPLTALDKREASYKAKLTAYGSIKSALSSFQSALLGINDAKKFQTIKAASSDGTVASASVTSNAVAGNYAINVSKVAQSQSLVAAGQASATAAIGTGAATTLTFDFGAISGGTFTAYNPVTGTGGTYSGATFTSNGSGAKSITINSSNNTLTGIRDAINAANIGVTASIINDGSAAPNRLVLSSSAAGASNSLNISVAGDATLAALLANNPAGAQNLHESVTAQNTEMTVNGVFVSRASTAFTDVIQGVTLNTLKVGATNVTLAQDPAAAASAVSAFVDAYNSLNKTLKDLSAYDATNKKAAVLQGDSAVRSIQSQLRGMLGTVLPTGTYTMLSQVGIAFQADGTLSLDATKLNSALAANPSAVAALFAATGSTTDSLVSYVSSTTKTQPGSYAVAITQLATQGNLVGGAAIGSLTITAGVNDALNVTVDGIATSITLTAKTYATNADLAAEIQSKINGATAISNAGSSVAVTQTGGVLTITSNRYGSASNVSVGGAGAANLLGTPTATVGLDVAGTIGGMAAIGSGQYLTGVTGSSIEGLKILINGGATGARGMINFTEGYAPKLNRLADSLLGTSGTLASRTDGINQSIKDIGNQRDEFNRRLAGIEARYRRQFTALDTLIGSMNQTSAYLTQQLSNLPK